jgi:hypothetical protein
MKFFTDVLNQLWTILGMFIAWIVMEGSAKTVVGYAIMATLFLWVVTLPIRLKDDE